MKILKTTESKISFLLGSLIGICISFSYFSTRGPSEGWGYWILLVATFAFWFFERIKQGKNNICIGPRAGLNITTGSNNLCLGKDSGLDITDQSNQIRIGDGARLDSEKGMVTFPESNPNLVITIDAFRILVGDDDFSEKIIAHYKSNNPKPQ